MEREVRGGIRWGLHVTPWLIHVNVGQNPLKCCEVISLQLIKVNEKKKSRFVISVFGVGGGSTAKAHKKTLGTMELFYNLTVVVVVVYIHLVVGTTTRQTAHV